ncbi:Uncharacterised protein [Mycobacteroides abscessus subsp. massiliense]|nr:Uncharacterised protein [Mycobacteroides abscessus subsp. massiliense]
MQVIREVGEGTLFLPGRDEGLHHVGADVAHTAEPISDVLTHRREVVHGFIHVRWQHRDAQAAAVGEIHGRFVLVVADRCQQTRHVFGGVVGLEVGGPEGHQPVPGGVRLVERVPGERKNGVPQRFHRRRGKAVIGHALVEALVLGLEDFELLLTHGLAQRIGLTHRV